MFIDVPNCVLVHAKITRDFRLNFFRASKILIVPITFIRIVVTGSSQERGIID